MSGLSRRSILKGLALGLGVAACRTGGAIASERAAYVGIETSARDGLSHASFFARSGERVHRTPLDFRAHGMAQNSKAFVVFPRRPGDRFAVIAVDDLSVRAVVAAPLDRRFYGHGAFTMDGRHLLVTENNLDTMGGSIGIYDMSGPPRRVDAMPLPGPGPHEIVRAPDRDLFYIALGGLETHPDYGRTPFNLSSFRSQILAFDWLRGTIDGLGFWPGSEGISLRHMAHDDAGRLYIGGQVPKGTRADGSDLIFVVENGSAYAVAEGQSLGGYVSSVAASGRTALIASTTSHTVLTLDGRNVVAADRIDGASAVALSPGVQAASGFQLLAIDGAEASVTAGFEFDNHGFALL